MLSPTSVYQPLKAFLASRPAEEQQITLTFAEIEAILGRRLPASAYRGGSWWANVTNPLNMGSQTMAWHEAGWRTTHVYHDQRVVTFIRQSV